MQNINKPLLTRSAAPSPVFKDGVRKRGFLRHAQDTEFIEVQGQPLPAGRQAEPLGLSSGRRQALAFRSGSRRVDLM